MEDSASRSCTEMPILWLVVSPLIESSVERQPLTLGSAWVQEWKKIFQWFHLWNYYFAGVRVRLRKHTLILACSLNVDWNSCLICLEYCAHCRYFTSTVRNCTTPFEMLWGSTWGMRYFHWRHLPSNNQWHSDSQESGRNDGRSFPGDTE